MKPIPVPGNGVPSESIPRACEQALAEALADVATELRLINVIDLIGYVHGQRYGNIQDLIHSSAELYFKQGSLRYACAAEADVRWEAPPSVSLGMEFRWRGATAFFRLQLEATSASIDIHHLALDTPGAAEDLPSRFASALADARLRPSLQSPPRP